MANPDTITLTLTNPVDSITLSPAQTVDTVNVNTVSEVTNISLTSTADVSTVTVQDAQNNLTVDINLNDGYVPVQSVNGKIGNVIVDVPVTSVNGQTGDVVITIPSSSVTSVNGQTGDVSLTLLQKYTTTNPTLTVTSGIATWTVSHGLGANVQVELRDATTNAIIEAEVIIGSTTATINFNSSLGSIASGTYRVVVIG